MESSGDIEFPWLFDIRKHNGKLRGSFVVKRRTSLPDVGNFTVLLRINVQKIFRFESRSADRIDDALRELRQNAVDICIAESVCVTL